LTKCFQLEPRLLESYWRAAGLTQIGELSFVVGQVARGAGMAGQEVFSAALAASLLSIFFERVYRARRSEVAGPRLETAS
jgi:predicted Kef-type K+ transport protein